MSNTLTITVSNIPQDALDQLWKDCINNSNESMGFKPERTNDIKLDFATLTDHYPQEVPEMFADLLVGALGCYSVQYFENQYNKKELQNK